MQHRMMRLIKLTLVLWAVLAQVPGASASEQCQLPETPSAETEHSAVSFEIYTVVPGDTLFAISQQFGVSLKTLQGVNGITDPTRLGVGQELMIPSGDVWEPEEVEVRESVEKPVFQSYRVDSVPLYFQDDYPDVRFGQGTVKTSGCSMVSLCMVANALTGYDYTPDELADYFNDDGENNMQRLEVGSRALGLPFQKSSNWHETWAALQQGKLVIALMEHDSFFTDTQHFIVLTGLNDRGLVTVNDSSRTNYTNWRLEEGFREGFADWEILQGYSGAWIYEMPQNPPRYREAQLDRNRLNYPQIQLNHEEMELLAKLIWVEARGECPQGQQAIAEIVFNRMMSEQFDNTLNGVIYGEGQFRSTPLLEDAEPWAAQYRAIDRALHGERVLPEDVVYFATTAFNDRVWGIIGNHVFCYEE